MARQKSLLKLDGAIGDFSFFKGKNGYQAREKSGVDGSRIATDPAFQRTRENGSEFGRAGKSGKILRSSIRSFLKKGADGRVVSRLTKEMMKVIKSDMTSERGERNVLKGNLGLLTGFDFNINAILSATVCAPYVGTIDRVTGACTIHIPAFIPTEVLVAAAGSTHYNIFSTAVAVDFLTGEYTAATEETAPLPLNNMASAVATLVNQLPANSPHPLFLLMGVEFLQEVNGNMYSLKTGSTNALAIVKVEVV
jgi:hypothetical protein